MGRMVSKQENLVGKVKGKIDFKKNIQLNMLRGRNDRIYCNYLRYSEDIIENQVLKAALHRANRFLTNFFESASANRNSFQEIISYCQKAMANVSNVRISKQDINGIKPAGVYVYYRPVINAAKMVLNEISLEASGNALLTNYVVPYSVSMEKLFEMYVRTYIKKSGIATFTNHASGITMMPYDYKIPVLKREKYYSTYIAGNIKPDIILYDCESNRYVIFDVKYKYGRNSNFSRNDRLQVLAYSLMFDCQHIGNIFPAKNNASILFYKNKILSIENKNRFYHQIEIAVNGAWNHTLYKIDDLSKITVKDFIKSLF